MDHKHHKIEYNKQLALLGVKFLHFILSVGLFYIFWMLFRYHHISVTVREIGFRYNYFMVIAYAVILFFFNRTYNSYLFGYNRIRNMLFSEFLSQVFSLVLVYVIVSLSWAKWRNPTIFLLMLVIQLFLDLLCSYCGNWFYFQLYPPRKTLLIYRNLIDKKRFGSIKGKPSERLYDIVEEFQYEGDSFIEIRHRLEGFEAIFVAGVNSRCRNGILKYCQENSIPGFFLPHIGDVIMQGAEHIQSFDSPVLYVNRKQVNPEYRIFKRIFDFVIALIFLIILSPTILVTALVVKLYDHGPALYKQTRTTKDGKAFKILKFRSMRVDAESDGIARLSTGENDDRITPVGRFIRKCRIDELPQLINILKGDMSFVGPRPERPEIAEQYCKKLPDFQLRLQVKAGLTGYAQVYGRYNNDPYEKLEFDLLYINHMSILTDIQIMFATFEVLFSKESTAGITDGAITAMDYPVEEEAAEKTEEKG